MIRSIANKSTAAVFCGHYVHTLPAGIQPGALRKLTMLDAASSAPDLLAAPTNNFEPTPGRRRALWRVRIRGDWYVRFRYVNGEAWDVEIAHCPQEELA